MAKDPKELAKQTAKEFRQALSGVFKSVIPDMKKVARKQVKEFEQTLVTGSGEKIQKDLDGLNKFISAFDFRIEDLSKNAEKLNKVREKLNEDIAKREEEAAKLREKNIFSELEIIKDEKTNQIEVRNKLLTEKQINNKKAQIIIEEKKIKLQEKENLEKIRQFQKTGKGLNEEQKKSLVAEIQNIQERKLLLEEEKKLFTGRSGRFDKRIGGFLDDFENALNDRAPDFLLPILQPLIDGARQIQKTISLIIDGFSFVTKGFKKLVPTFETSFKGTFDGVKKVFDKSMTSFLKNFKGTFNGVNKVFGKGISSISKGFKGFDKGLKGVFNGVSKGFKLFRTKGLAASVKALSTFAKRIVIAGLSALIAFVPLMIPMLKVIGIIGLVIAGLVLLKTGFSLFTEKVLPYIREKLANFGLVIKKIASFVREKLTAFAEGVMELPGKIANFFNKIFVKIQNFFIDAINSVIALINRIKIGDDIELLQRVEEKELPADMSTGEKIEIPSKEEKEIQNVEDQKELDNILGKDEEKPKVITEENEKFNKLIENFNKNNENTILELDRDKRLINPEDFIKEEKKEPMTFAQNNSPINNVNQINNQSIQANLARNVDDTFYVLNKHSA